MPICVLYFDTMVICIVLMIIYYLKSPGCSKKAVWCRLPLLHLWVISSHYVMHQREKLTVSLCFEIKMSCVGTASKEAK